MKKLFFVHNTSCVCKTVVVPFYKHRYCVFFFSMLLIYLYISLMVVNRIYFKLIKNFCGLPPSLLFLGAPRKSNYTGQIENIIIHKKIFFSIINIIIYFLKKFYYFWRRLTTRLEKNLLLFYTPLIFFSIIDFFKISRFLFSIPKIKKK